MVNEDYLACSAYEGQAMHETEGNFSAFHDAESQRHFFALLDADGKVLLKSEGYPQPAARENGIQSVIKNRVNRDFYSVKQEGDTYYLSLRAANYREIARSCDVGSEAEAMALMAFATGEQVRGGVQATAMAATKERADDRIDDDYMACKSYAGHGGSGELTAFTHESGQHYFALYDSDGDVLMRSEGYPTTAARDNGMASVTKNRDMEERYAVLEKMGRFFVILKAGNHQEIARSCPFNSEAEARAIFPSGRAAMAKAATDNSAAEAAAALAATAATTASFAATTPEVVAETITETVVADAPVEAVAEAVADIEDDYLSCRDYHGHTTTPREGFRTFFNEKSNKYYFAIVDTDGDVTLRSEGHLTAADRDEDMADVVRNMFKKERYNIKKVGFHHHFIVLRNADGKEIARSCAHDTMESVHAVAPFLNPEKPAEKIAVAAPIAMAAAVSMAAAPAASVVETLTATETVNEAPLATVIGTVAATVAATSMAAATPVIVETVETVPVVVPPAPVVEAIVETPSVPKPPAASVDVEDDYLPCKEYEGRPISDKANSVTMFKHSNGQFYFAIYNADGSVRLRSEGFRTSQDRDKELSGALKNLNNADMYTTVRRGDYYMSILKDKTGREVGRSCLHKDQPTPVIVAAPIVAPVIAAAAVAAVAAVIPEIKVPEVKVPEFKAAAPVYVAPEIVEEAAAASGFQWWWLLLPLLALLGWWMFGKGCGTPAPTAVTVAPPAIETPKVVEPAATAAAPAAPSCDLNWILFDFDKADITAAAKAELAQMAKILKENKDYVGVLSAHTDGRGTATYNDDLSLRRAAAAKRTLVAMGIEAGRLSTKADGKGAPVAQNTQDDTGRQFNRRVELYIQDKNGKNLCQSIAPNIPNALKASGK